jgi:hypothetical protein
MFAAIPLSSPQGESPEAKATARIPALLAAALFGLFLVGGGAVRPSDSIESFGERGEGRGRGPSVSMGFFVFDEALSP